MAYYKSPYIQRGYGLGSIFNSLLRVFNPAKKHIARILSQPSTQKILKSVGKEAVSAGTDLLIEKASGNKDLKTVLDKRIEKAKNRISETINEAKKLQKRPNSKKYTRINNSSDSDDVWNELRTDYGKKSKKVYTFPKKKTKLGLHPKLSKRRRTRADYYTSVFD